MKHFLIPAVLVAACGLAAAKIPAPVLDDAAKAKAAEAAGRPPVAEPVSDKAAGE